MMIDIDIDIDLDANACQEAIRLDVGPFPMASDECSPLMITQATHPPGSAYALSWIVSETRLACFGDRPTHVYFCRGMFPALTAHTMTAGGGTDTYRDIIHHRGRRS